MTGQIRVIINDIDITELVAGRILHSEAINQPSTLDVGLILEGNALEMLDLKGTIVLEMDVAGQTSRLFTGVTVHGAIESNRYVLQCKDPTQFLSEGRVPGFFGKGMLPGEILYYLVTQTIGPNSADRAIAYIGDDNKGLAKDDFLFRKRRYIFVAPIPACTLRQEEITIGDIVLYRANKNGLIDDRIIAASLPEPVPNEWSEGGTRVRFYVQAEGFDEAFEKGRVRLRKLLDFLSFGSNFSTPSFRTGEGHLFQPYDRSRTRVNVAETPWGYVRDILPGRVDRFWLYLSQSHRESEPFTLTGDDPLLSLYPLIKKLVEEDEYELDVRQRSALNALHALRRSRQAANTLDSLHHFWQGIEFLVSSYSPPDHFTSADRRALKRLCKCLIGRRYKESNREDTEARDRMLNRMTDGLANPTLRDKWECFCKTHDVEYPESDVQFMWKKMRSTRNHDVHGRATKVDRNDVERASAILEKAIAMALAGNVAVRRDVANRASDDLATEH